MDSGYKVLEITNAHVIKSGYNDPFCDLHLASFQLMAFCKGFCHSTYRLTMFLLMAPVVHPMLVLYFA